MRWQRIFSFKEKHINCCQKVRRAKLLANEMHKSRNFQSLKSDVLLSSPSAYQSITPFLTSKHWKFNYISFDQGIFVGLIFHCHEFNFFSWKRSNAVVSRFNRRRSLLIEVQPQPCPPLPQRSSLSAPTRTTTNITILIDDHKLTYLILQVRIQTCVLVEGNEQGPQTEGQWWLHYSSSYPPGENYLFLFIHHIYLDISIYLQCRY